MTVWQLLQHLSLYLLLETKNLQGLQSCPGILSIYFRLIPLLLSSTQGSSYLVTLLYLQ